MDRPRRGAAGRRVCGPPFSGWWTARRSASDPVMTTLSGKRARRPSDDLLDGRLTFGDACIKAIGTDLPLSQILVLRGIVASLFIGLLCWRMGGFRTRPAGRDWRS